MRPERFDSRRRFLVLPDGRWSELGTWLWRNTRGRFARVELAEVIYHVRALEERPRKAA